MTETIKERRRKDRELQLSRREFAYLALEWHIDGLLPVISLTVFQPADLIAGITRPPACVPR